VAGTGGGDGGAGGEADGGAGWQTITAGVFTGCVTKDGAVSCWGDNRSYQFGNGTRDAQPVLRPVPAVTGLTIRQMAVGGGFACGITLAGELYCWGADMAVSPLYMPGPTTPTRMFSWAKFKSVSAGTFHACGLLEDGSALCWGSYGFPLGGTPNFDCCADGGLLKYVDGGAPDPVAARVMGGPWASVTAGYGVSCGVDVNGDGFCWGTTTHHPQGPAGALGDGDTSLHDAQFPVAVVGGHKFKWIHPTSRGTYALGVDGTPYCWGCDEIRVGAPPLRHADPFPMSFPAGVVVTDIQGSLVSCALASDGAVYCWGNNTRGGLGIGSADNLDHPTPTRVINLPRIVSIAVGAGACALSAEGNRYCWGNNDVGFLGSGATEDIYTPRVLP
jgi:alpha-tubulin suppressor-like RCC1 family protein